MNSPEPGGRGHLLAVILILIGAAGALVAVLTVPRTAVAVAVAALAIATALALRVAINHVRLRALRRVATAYAADEFEARAAIGGVDSIARLAGDLNALGEQLLAARAALEAQRRLLDGALGSLAEGVACIDDLDRVLYANPAWRHLAAGGNGSSQGGTFYEHLPAAALSAAVANARASGHSDQISFEHRRRHLQAVVARATPEALVVVLHDVTELKRLEGARRGFVASVSHELKTPLTAIAGFAETLLDGTLEQDPTAARDFVGKIARHAERLTVLVRDVLTLSRLDQGVWEVHPAALPVPEVIRQVCDEHQSAAAAKGVQLRFSGPDELVVTTDRELVNQLLGNLLSNAIRYNRPGGSVTITYSASADQLTIRVADTGIGIPAEHHERIFERFYRIDAHRSRASGGTGLGLAIVKQLVDALRGTIGVESGADGIGTVFAVMLPRSDPRAGSPLRHTA